MKTWIYAWVQRKLGEVADINPKSTDLPEQFEYVDLESVDGTSMISHRTEHKDSAPSCAQRIAKRGDLFFQTVRPYQKNNYFFDLPHDNYVFSTGYAQLRPKGDNYFLFSRIQEEKFVANILDRCTGTSYPAINSNDLTQMNIGITVNLNEQISIGNFFRTLDNIIALYKRKLDSLKQLKKAYLQQMFPQDGETVPKFRFAGFTGDWIQQTINDIADVVTGSTPPTKEREFYNGGYLFVSPADIQGNRYIETTTNTLSAEGFNKGRKIKQGASFFVCIGSTIGKIAQATTESVTNQQINSIIGKDCMDDDFIYTLLEKESEKIRKLSATQAVPIINKTTFENIILTLPEIREEQKAVGNFFRNLDEQIATQQTKLDNLKQLKSAYLQKMFVYRLLCDAHTC